MKSVENDIELKSEDIGIIGGMSFNSSDSAEFEKNRLRVEDAWRYVVGGAATIIGGGLTFFKDSQIGYLMMTAGLATYINGRDLLDKN